MAKILLIGQDEALLEGLVQSLAALGHSAMPASSLTDAGALATLEQPLVAVVDHSLVEAAGDALGIPLAPGGALVLYRSTTAQPAPLPPPLQRAVLAELSLPLERKRLAALVQHVEERARATGRASRPTPPETTPAI